MRSAVPSAALLGVVLLCAGLTSGCGGSDRPSAARTSPGAPTTSSTPDPSATPSTPIDTSVDCARIFARPAADALAGEKLGSPTREGFSGLTACRWTSARTGTYVQVVAVPGATWAKVLPSAIGTVLDSDLQFEGRDKLDQALRLVRSGGTLTSTAACGIFSTMVTSLQGQPKGSTEVFNYVPSDDAPQALNGQACVRGRYYSVQLASADLKAGPALNSRITRALHLLTR